MSDRLLSPEEIVTIVKQHNGDLVKMWNTEVVEGTLTVDSCMNYVLKAQRDLTASIKDAECQKKIEEIFKEIEENEDYKDYGWVVEEVIDDVKSKYLGKEV